MRAIPVNHSVEATGFVISGVGTTVAFTGDTGPTELFWEELNRLPRLDALFMELSLPNALQRFADVSLHLTPQTAGAELEKLSHSDLPVFLYHLKPAFAAILEKEIAELGLQNLRVIHDGEVITVRPRRVTVGRARAEAKRSDLSQRPEVPSFMEPVGEESAAIGR